jgi:CHASE3 domain sensor protein
MIDEDRRIIIGLLFLIVVLFLALAISVFLREDTDELCTKPIAEKTVLDTMRDVRESMEKLNEALRDFEDIKEITIGKDSSGDTDNQE